MSVESLPYTLLLLLAQFTAGTAVMVLYTQLRGTYEAAFVRVCSWMVVSGALLTALTALAIEPSRQAEAFALDPELLDPVRAASMAMLLFSVFHWIYLRRDDEAFLANATGATTAGLGVVTLIFLAGLVRLPTWSIIGPLLTLFAGSLTIGAFSVAMIWGHWYLVKPSLDEKPLNDLALIAIAAVVLELAITAVNAIIPTGAAIDSNALLAVSLPENPGFWLRVGIGLLFPIALAYMAYASSRERSMMSATGLLYIAVGAILAGEALGRGLLFVTGAPV
ncbi:MAG TPA: hypothetical protein VG845_14740 [Dehalococcoidia bacterium]|nr:hypothetical protein [Dehalococcoidia bacterium]